ncbi:nucleotide-diphospho-sugar transferase [Methylomonas sp. EFPC1]|uniref:nucleotide-diphospho-sugar transferase n=1 Tax=Methylomonas sp. EFPC1 TaxID=2812647 RepID=UPI00196869F5|nr:nucleotide-diphospho-sugar transferase [Methylomonas sp. EFPC1]QSA99631.1 nucleotide-diphospho-sugar transferase [Methylomonas sp. EFPC1]
MKSPILLLVFNRPHTTLQVFESIRRARPPKLYVAADGPRRNVSDDIRLCAEVRNVINLVDWPCEVKTLYSDDNLGCKFGPIKGISWFFENEEEGIVLEDDVLPISTFFTYCDELLERYRENQHVGVISGCNLISRQFCPETSYFFTRYNQIWGWATWRRAWSKYDHSMSAWPSWRDQGGLESMSSGSKVFEYYWKRLFNATYYNSKNVTWWDYQWAFSCWFHGMLGVQPKTNQITNIGFGEAGKGTHTTTTVPKYISESSPKPLIFPLNHPEEIARNFVAEALIDKHVFSITLRWYLLKKARNTVLVSGVLRILKNIANFSI